MSKWLPAHRGHWPRNGVICGLHDRMAYALRMRALLTLVLLALPGIAPATTWGDPAKSLRVVFEIDVTGFDPAATRAALREDDRRRRRIRAVLPERFSDQ